MEFSLDVIVINNLNVPLNKDIAKQNYNKFHFRLPHHTNPLILNLSSHLLPGNPPRKLQRKLPRDSLQL